MSDLNKLELIEREMMKRGLIKPEENLSLDEGHYFEKPEDIEKYYNRGNGVAEKTNQGDLGIEKYIDKPDSKERSFTEPVDSRSNPESDEDEYSYADRAAQVGRGFVGGVGALGDLVHRAGSAIKNAPRMTRDFQYENPEDAMEYYDRVAAGKSAREYTSPDYSGKLKEKVDELYGKSLAPKEKTGEFLEGVGSFMVPVPGSGYLAAGRAAKGALAAGKGLMSAAKPLAKTVSKEAGMASGASAALSTPDITEEGTVANAVEKMGKGLFGAHYGNKAVSKATIDTIRNIPGAFKPGNVAAKVMSWKTKANPETFQLADKHNIKLPFNAGLEGTGAKFNNFLANTYLKTAFVSNAYTEALKNADMSFVNSIKNKIETLGPRNLRPNEASVEYRALIKEQEKEAEKLSSELYEEAEKLLKPGDKVVPKNTQEYMGSLKEMLNRDIQSPGTKKVASILDKMATKWGLVAERPKINIDTNKASPITQKRINEVLDSFMAEGNPIEIERLNGVRKEIGSILKNKERVVGAESVLEGIRGSLMKDMESASNKSYVDALKYANKNFRENVALRFRSDMANSLLRGEAPVEAFNLMNNVENIKELEKIAGENAKSKQIFNSLKKAKVNEIFSNAVKEDEISLGNFINHFNTGKKNEVLEQLLGKKSYNDLVEISKVAKAYKKSGREFLNTSATTLTKEELSKMGTLVNAAIGIATGSGLGLVPGAAITLGAPILASRIVSNPNVVKKMREYALSRSKDLKSINGKPSKESMSMFRELEKMTLNDAKFVLNSVNYNKIEDEDEE